MKHVKFDRLSLASLSAVAAISLASHAQAQFSLTLTLTPPTTESYARFGETVACDGYNVAVGAPWYTTGLPGEGLVARYSKAWGVWSSAYLYWLSSTNAYANFGRGLDLDGSSVVAGAWGLDSYAGQVFKPTATGAIASGFYPATADHNAGDAFGWSAAASGGITVVGAPEDDEGGVNAGAVYFYSTLSSKKVKGPAANSDFGFSVAIDGNYIAVGAPNLVTPSGYDGAVYVYQRMTAPFPPNTYSLRATLYNPDGFVYNFGQHVAISGTRVVVGHDSVGYGRVYVFDSPSGTASPSAIITSPEIEYGSEFGEAVAVDGDTILVGAHGKNGTASADVGAAYIFRKYAAGWYFDQKLTGTTSGGAEFGWSVALDGCYAVIGAPGYNIHSGRAYVFENAGCN